MTLLVVTPSTSSLFFFFFFSSRRRHTRLQGDWSSDVCSSDLPSNPPYLRSASRDGRNPNPLFDRTWYLAQYPDEIGRASCRERVQISVVAVSLKKKNKNDRRISVINKET